MPQTVNSLSLGLLFVGVCSLFLPAYWLLPSDVLFELINLMVVSISFGVMVGFHPVAWDTVRLPAHDVTAPEALITGQVIGALALGVLFGFFYVYRVTDDLYWLNHPIGAAARWVFICSQCMVLLASGSRRGLLPSSTYKRAGIFVTVAILLCGLLISFGIG